MTSVRTSVAAAIASVLLILIVLEGAPVADAPAEKAAGESA